MSTTLDSRSQHLTPVGGKEEEGKEGEGGGEAEEEGEGGEGGRRGRRGGEGMGGRQEREGRGGEGGAEETTDWQSIANHINPCTHSSYPYQPHSL